MIKKYVLISLVLLSLFSASAFALEDPEAKIAKVIENYVIATYPDWADLEIRVTFKYADRLFERLRALEDGAKFKIADVYRDLKPVGNVIFPIDVTAGGETKKIFVRANIEVFKKVVVAARQIKRGTLISLDDVMLEDRDIAMLPQSYHADLDRVLLKETKTSVPKNSTVFEWMIKEMPQVRRGDELMVLIKGPNLLVRTTGYALEDGYDGKWLKLKIKGKDAKDSLEGRLISSNEVEVILK
ncbi:flagellar basal body P-ring formation chaperone FlgA [Candidatus Margulisiibacteriota bacterium]